MSVLLTGWGSCYFLHSLVYTVISCFPSSICLLLPPYDIIKNREGVFFVVGKSVYLLVVGHSKLLGVFLCLAVVLFYLQQCTGQTKVKQGEVYI